MTADHAPKGKRRRHHSTLRPPLVDRLINLVDIDDHYDSSGRLLHERKVPADVIETLLRNGLIAETKLVECKYTDSRQNTPPHTINASGLVEMSRHEEETLEALDELKLMYKNMTGHEVTTVGDVYALCMLTGSLPVYLFRRAHNPIPNGQLPPYISGLYKALNGIRIVTETMQNLPTFRPSICTFSSRNLFIC